jgi:hypothetical protein
MKNNYSPIVVAAFMPFSKDDCDYPKHYTFLGFGTATVGAGS